VYFRQGWGGRKTHNGKGNELHGLLKKEFKVNSTKKLHLGWQDVPYFEHFFVKNLFKWESRNNNLESAINCNLYWNF
jgi:hypothetical protein